MKSRLSIVLGLFAAACISAAIVASSANLKERPVMNTSGSFDIELEPQPADNPQAKAANLARQSIYKQFQGAIQGTSSGEMLATVDDQQSGAYVAIEKVTGSLQGRSGTFVLMHSGGMRRGVPENWSITVVPDSGTQQLAGLTGTMTIKIDNGHFYDFQYTLPES